MISAPQEAPQMWILDDDAERLKMWTESDVSPLRRFRADYHIRGYRTIDAAERAMRECTANQVAVVISDSLGFRITSTNKPLISGLLSAAHGAMVILFSNRPAEHLATLKQFECDPSRIVNVSIDRSGAEGVSELIETLETWQFRSKLPAACRIRGFYERNPEQDFPFLEDGNGGYLTHADIYREIVNGTHLGKQLEQSVMSLPEECYQ